MECRWIVENYSDKKYDGRGMWFGKEFLEVSPTD